MMASTKTSSDPDRIHATPDNVWLKGKTVWGILAAGVSAFMIVLPFTVMLAFNMGAVLTGIEGSLETQGQKVDRIERNLERLYEDLNARIKALEIHRE